MKKCIAVPVTAGVLSAHFGHCEQFYFAVTEDGKILEDRFQTPPAHEPGLYPKWVKEQGGELVIAGGMGQKARDLFAQNAVETIVGAPNEDPKVIVEKYLASALQTTENSCNHDHEHK